MGPHKTHLGDEVRKGIDEDFGPLGPHEWAAVALAAERAARLGRDPETEARDAAHLVTLAREPAQPPDRMKDERQPQRVPASRAERDHARAIAERIEQAAASHPDVLDARRAAGLDPHGLTEDAARRFLRAREHRAEAGSIMPAVVRFADEDGRRETVAVRPGSPPAVLAEHAGRLRHVHPFNALALAEIGADAALTWLVATGQCPALAAVAVMRGGHGTVETVTITVAARVVTPRTVLQAVRRAQRDVLGHRKGRRSRSRTFAVVAFVEQRAHGPALLRDVPWWRETWRAWNRAQRRRKQKFLTPRDMRAAYESGREATFRDPRDADVRLVEFIETRAGGPPTDRDERWWRATWRAACRARNLPVYGTPTNPNDNDGPRNMREGYARAVRVLRDGEPVSFVVIE